MPNGVKLRGVTGDVDRVSVQSSEAASHLLTRRRWSFMPAQWTTVELARDELLVLTCNDGEAVVELKSLGGPHGSLMVDCAERGRYKVQESSTLRVHLPRNQAVFLRTQEMRYPRTPGSFFLA